MKYLSSALLALQCAVVLPVAAQSADVIRGQVTTAQREPIENANVSATSVSGGVTRAAHTDRTGRFTITFAGGDGDYWIAVTSIGFSPKRFEVKRTADQDILIADVRLIRSAALLDTVTIAAARGRVGRNARTPDIGGGDKAIDPNTLPAKQAGDLNATAASLPGVQPIFGADGDPAGFSVLGLSADQNSITLNGGAFSGGSLPRDAALSTSLNQSPYDVSRGGFSGAQLNVIAQPGSNYVRRTNSLNLDSPRIQWTDPVARELGQQYSNVSLGGLLSGPIRFDKSFYSISYQLGRRSSDLRTLLNTDPLGLEATGIAGDSVRRLLAIAQRSGIPSSVAGLGDRRLSDQGLVFGSLDFAPPSSSSGQALNVTFNGGWNKQTPSSALTNELPAHSGDHTTWNAGVQLRHNAYVNNVILSETALNLGENGAFGTPYARLPSGSVLVNSLFADGASGVTRIGFGGSSALSVSQTNRTIELKNQLSWFSVNNRHRLKLSSELRHDQVSADQSANQLGTFSFNSIADFDAGRPTSFTRQLSPNMQRSGQVIGALSFSDSYRPTEQLQVQYGARVDANRFTTTPSFNPDIESLFGMHNDRTPNRIYASPRVGFSWAYGSAPQIGGVDGAVRGPRAVVRGGAGVFQNTPTSALLGASLVNTGLPSGLQQMSCVGAAAPIPDWNRYAADPLAIPSRCADGAAGTVFASTVPNVTLFTHDWSAPRAARGNLNWQGPILNNRLTATIEGAYSLNLNQSSFSDLNFAPNPQFSLSDEGGRPVFVRLTSIVPSTGAIASRDARVTQSYSHVTELRSDLESQTRQIKLQLLPSTFSSSVAWGVSYVHTSVREQYRGFSSTAGNPLDVERSRGSLDSRHQIVYNIGYNVLDAVRVNWYGQFRSGNPFTPGIAGDVNGDGYSNDRAFIFDPTKTDDPVFAAQMRSVLATGSRDARSCLDRQLGQLAARNSCEAPWTSEATLTLSFNPLKLRLPQRASIQFQLGNPLGAADLALHGESRLRGWGQSAFPDPTLLFVRGFDPSARRYTYTVNPHFGSASPQLGMFRTPVTLTALMRFDLGPTRERQSLTQTLDRGRTQPGAKVSEQVLKAMYVTGGVLNPMAQLLRQSDTLELTGGQADSLASMNVTYTTELDSIWSDVAKELAALPATYDQGEAYRRYRRAREASVDLLIGLAPRITSLLTGSQQRRLPPFVTIYLDRRYLAGIRSGTAGNAGGGAFANAIFGSVGGAVQRTDIIVARP
ncbi:MAG: carboxypeptidase-like regulatory domain-containing protein [bacterium]